MNCVLLLSVVMAMVAVAEGVRGKDICCEPQKYHGFIRTYSQNSNRQNYDISESYAESHLMVDRKLERVTFVHLKRGHDKHIQIIDDYKHKIRYIVDNFSCKRYELKETLRNICMRSGEGRDINTGASYEIRKETIINYVYYEFQHNGKFVEYVGRRQVSSANCIPIADSYQISDVTNPKATTKVHYDDIHFNYTLNNFDKLPLSDQTIPVGCMLTQIMKKNNDAIPININHILSGFNRRR